MVKTEIKTFHQTTYSEISPDRPELSTKGKNALITGGGSGIGAAIAQSLGRSGIANLAILGRTEKTLQESKSKIEANSPGTRVWTYIVDIADDAALKAAVESYAVSIKGSIDILIANAGYMSDIKTIAESESDDWWKGFEVSVRGNYNLLRAFQSVAAPHATVVHVGTAAIHVDYMKGYSSYRASKIAAYKLFEYYYYENPEFTVIQIHPGLIDSTGMTKKFAVTVDELGLVFDDTQLPADFAVWAASDEAKFLNGRMVWAAWDVTELKAMKEEVEADETRFTMQLLV